MQATTKEVRMAHSEERTHSPEVREPEGNGLVGYAAIKYTAIVVIVLAILAFVAWYILPRIG
jgi:cell division septal protein FtsQ